MDEVLKVIPEQITASQNKALMDPIKESEVVDALKGLGGTKPQAEMSFLLYFSKN